MGDLLVGEFRITVSHEDNFRRAFVKVESNGPLPYIYWMCACEYFLHQTAERSVDYEAALKALSEGAKSYKTKVIRVDGGKQDD